MHTSGRRRQSLAIDVFLAGIILIATWALWWGESRPVGLLGGAAVALGLPTLAWLANRSVHGWYAWHNYRFRMARRRDYVPPLTAEGALDWSALGDYMAVAEANGLYPDRTVEALLAGPLARYFELCADDARGRSQRARTMEFARGAVNGFKRRRAWWWGASARVDAAVAAELEARFGSTDRWLIEVYQGLRNHHATGPV